MGGGDELSIGRRSAGNEATLLFRNEAIQPVPRVLAFNKTCSKAINDTPFFQQINNKKKAMNYTS